MRAPFQDGDFPGPVKYGYLNVGVVEDGPSRLLGRTVFCLHPHQTAYVVPAAAVTVVPDDVPVARAPSSRGWSRPRSTRSGTPGPWSVTGWRWWGAGAVGCSVARLLARIPGVTVTLVDVDPGRAPVAAALGADFALPDRADGGRDLVFHTSATSAGLQASLELLAAEGTVIELSWYGDAATSVSLGGSLPLGAPRRPGQPGGHGVAARRGRRTTGDRLALALELLRDPAFDCLLTGESPFETLPGRDAPPRVPRRCRRCATRSTYDTVEVPCSA